MRRKLWWAALAVAAVAVSFAYGTTDVAIQSIQFDLGKIGASIYEAHARRGRWPADIADLEGTEYLRMPYRRKILEDGLFVVVWHRDLDPDPAANRDRILAYDNGSLFARLGLIWACRGDLRIDRIRAAEIPVKGPGQRGKPG